MSENHREWFLYFNGIIISPFSIPLFLNSVSTQFKPPDSSEFNAQVTFIVLLIAITIFLISIVERNERARADESFLSSQLYKKWQITEAEMGLRELEDNKANAPVAGDYRNHEINIFETWESDGEENYTHYTYYDLESKNPALIPIFIRAKNFKSEQRYFFSLRQARDLKRITIGEFVVIITKDKENDIRALLGPSVQSKLMSLGKFSLEIDFSDPGYIARYRLKESIKNTKKNPERFHSIIDTLIDIVEKIEALPSVVASD